MNLFSINVSKISGWIGVHGGTMTLYLSIIAAVALVDTLMLLCYKLSRDVPPSEGGWGVACIRNLSEVDASPFSPSGNRGGACL